MNTTSQANIRNKERHVGIDIGKDTLDVYVYECEKHWQTSNTVLDIKNINIAT